MKKLLIPIIALSTVKGYTQTQEALYSQYYFKNIPQAPSTSTFMRYGELQNSEYTGSNSPEIPIYTIESNNLKIPLSLKYISGNGIKVTDESGSFGLGWDMNLPTITQSVLGQDDLSMGLGADKFKLDFMYPSGYDGYLPRQCTAFTNTSNPGIGTYSYYKSVDRYLPFAGKLAQYMGNEGILIDGSPDIYTLNLFGEKIIFTISNFPTKNGQNGNTCIIYGGITDTFTPVFTVLNKKGYNIQYNNLTFVITNPKGVKYFFNQKENVRNGLISLINRNFVVNQIQDTNGNSIYFQYKNTENVKNVAFYSRNLNYSYDHTSGAANLPIASMTGLYQHTEEYDFIYYNSIGGSQTLNPLYTNAFIGYTHTTGLLYGTEQNYLNIEKIYGDFGSVDFTYSSRIDHPTLKLDKIEVNNSHKITETVRFFYDYFTAENTSKVINSNYDSVSGSYYDNISPNLLTKKLKLESVKINDDDYRFGYFSTPIPPKNSFAQDYWGYPNGSNNNVSLFPNPSDFLYPITLPVVAGINNNIKTANENFVKAGLLEKIIYPTKGYSTYDYELNEADNLFNSFDKSQISKGKGVRLRQQLNYDHTNAIVSKDSLSYYQGKDTNPLFLFNRNRYRTLNVYPVYYTGEYSLYNIVNINSQNANSASPLSSGNYVGYSKVVRQKTDANSSQNNGKIITQYTNGLDIHHNNFENRIPLSMPSTQGNGDQNGKVLNTEIYDKNNKLLRKTENSYKNEYYNIQYGSSFALNSRYVVNTNQNNGGAPMEVFPHSVSIMGYFPILYKESLLTKSKMIEYFNGIEYNTDINYNYDPNNILVTKQTTTPESSSIFEEYFNTSQILRFSQANILSESTGKRIIKNGKQVYRQDIKYDDTSHFNPSSIITRDLIDTTSATEVVYNLYDKGRLLQYTTKGGVPITIIWGYKGNLPIAQIEGVSYSQIMQLFGLDGSNSLSYKNLEIVKKSDEDIDDASELLLIDKLDEFRSKAEFKDFKISTYTYDPLVGVKSITPPSGIREVYLYDSANRLMEIRENNAGNVLKEYKYYYAPTKFYSNAVNKSFTKNNCPAGMISSSLIYSVPAAKYESIIDQADADQQAENEGQNYANANLTCYNPYCTLNTQSSANFLMLQYAPFEKINNTVNAQIFFQITANPGLNWSGGVLVGYIDSLCWPSSTITRSSGNWQITIYPTSGIGQVVLRWTGSGEPGVGGYHSVNFTYNLN